MTENTKSTAQDAPKYSPLHMRHLAAGARMIEFAGWQMPVQYKGIREEHIAVRTKVGVFDISHMGQLFLSGPEALEQLDGLLTNRLTALAEGQGQYTFLLNEAGGVIDDLIAYRVGLEEFLLVVNASKISEDTSWIAAHIGLTALLRNDSDLFGGLAVQGPQSASLYTSIFHSTPPPRNHILLVPYEGTKIYAAGTGYTGEEGFELFFPKMLAEVLWDTLLAAGAEPCGLGARDTLRLEMCYPLNGADLSPDCTPLEAGLGFFVDLNKGDFIGKVALLAQKRDGLSSKLCAIRVAEKSPPVRSHYSVLVEGKPVAETTSGVLSPSLGYGIAMAYLPVEKCKVGTQVEIEIRQKRYSAVVNPKPFYKVMLRKKGDLVGN